MFRSSVCVSLSLLQALVAALVVDEGPGENSNASRSPTQGEWQAGSNGRFYSRSKADCCHSR